MIIIIISTIVIIITNIIMSVTIIIITTTTFGGQSLQGTNELPFSPQEPAIYSSPPPRVINNSQ